MKIIVEYTLDNDNWSDEEFEDAPIEEFTVTIDMIRDLIIDYTKMEKGSVIHEILNIKTT